MIRKYVRPLGLWICAVVVTTCCVVVSGNSYAQSDSEAYPTTQDLTTQPMDGAKRSILETLVNGKLTAKDFPKLLLNLCPHNLSQAPVKDDSIKSSVADNRAIITTELLFEKQQGASSAMPQRFSFFVDFSPTRVLLQHLAPRFTTDAAGFSVPIPTDMTRPVRVEGTMSSDILTLIPPVRECGMQALVVCPRQYQKIDRLVASPYALQAARFLVEAKADGVAASPDGKPLRIMASIRHSEGVTMPQEWSSVANGSQTVSAAKTFSHDRSKPDTLPPFVPITSWPFSVAIESRVDFGSETAPLKTATKRTNVEISKFTVMDKPATMIGKNSMLIEGGECYLIAKWSEERV